MRLKNYAQRINQQTFYYLISQYKRFADFSVADKFLKIEPHCSFA